MSQRPNILQITTHDSGRHLSCYGYRTVQTPAIDALAADGVKFTNYFATVPICCASRASMLTGLYPQSHGLLDLCFPPFDWRLNRPEQHLSHLLGGHGYHTRLIGFQHEAEDLTELGFADTFAEMHAANLVPCRRVAEQTAAFLAGEAAARQPFYAQVGFFETHTPFDFAGTPPDSEQGVQVPAYLEDDPASREVLAHFQGALRRVDEAVGFILHALERSGLADDTILVFTSDHGPELPRAKWHLYDPGLAVALLMRYPRAGWRGGRVCGALLHNVDYLPTILELAGLPAPTYLEGRSCAGLSPVNDAVYAMYHKTQVRSVRTERWKWIRHYDAATDYARLPVRLADQLQLRGAPRTELYDLDADPNEFNNLGGRPELAVEQQRLDNLLWCWLERVHDPLLSGPVRTPSYEATSRDYAAWKTNRQRCP
ncbi:MAG: sulfatase family protein [Anaerolineae bacterium]